MNDLNRKSVFNINELSSFIGISKSTLYKYTSQKMIPHYIRGKFLFFDRKEIINWLKENPIKPYDNDTTDGGISVAD